MQKFTVMPSRATVIAQKIAPQLAPRQSVLEIGAGKGHVARVLQQTTNTDIKLVDVVDYNETDLPLELYDGIHLPFRDRAFDYSLLIFVLHHTPEPRIVLREALRVSRCGVIVVENHVEGWLWQHITRMIDSLPHLRHGVPICYHAYTLNEWQQIFTPHVRRVELLEQFTLDNFWQNFVMRLEK